MGSLDVADTMEKTVLDVEVRLKPGTTCTTCTKLVKESVARLLQSKQVQWRNFSGPVAFERGEDHFMDNHVERVFVCEREDKDSEDLASLPLLFWQVELKLHVYQLSLDEPCEEIEGDEEIASFTEYFLPSVHFEGLWESLRFDDVFTDECGGTLDVKTQLLNYSRSALLFSALRVNHNVIAWNRLILLHGPPGTGKTSLCKALAHKLSVRHFSANFHRPSSAAIAEESVHFSKLIEINAHSLFSKWFSESGKLVSKLFQQIRDLAELALDLDSATGTRADGNSGCGGETSGGRSLVFVLIDEVESLAVARKQSIQGNEPSDGIRAVNALLTQLDQLREYPNVYVMCTSNVSDAIDEAFLDRADLQIHLGNPSLFARYDILAQGLQEMHRVGLISDARVRSLGETPRAVREEAKSLSSMGGEGPHDDFCDVSGAGGGGYANERSLLGVCRGLDGYSGRQLRKLPFLCFSKTVRGTSCTLQTFLRALSQTAQVAPPRENNTKTVPDSCTMQE